MDNLPWWLKSAEDIHEERYCWAVQFRKENKLDGKRCHLDCDTDHACGRVLFKTRQEARDYAQERWGYIKNRPDLQAEPHGWKVPKVVQVRVTIETVR